jgi:hypothetical protein
LGFISALGLGWATACTVAGLWLAMDLGAGNGWWARAACLGVAAAVFSAGQLVFFRAVAGPAFPRAATAVRVGMEVGACVGLGAGSAVVLAALALAPAWA